MRYDRANGVFLPTPDRYLGYQRGFTGVYGWIVGYGTPPDRHLDVFVPTEAVYSLGQKVAIRIVGCFRRGDGDHKLIAVESSRPEQTLSGLPQPERSMLDAIYPEIREGDAWLEHDDAVDLIGRYTDRA